MRPLQDGAFAPSGPPRRDCELGLVPTRELIAEVLARMDHGMFVGMQVVVDGGLIQYVRQWSGNHHVCAGLAEDMKFLILTHLHLNEHSGHW